MLTYILIHLLERYTCLRKIDRVDRGFESVDGFDENVELVSVCLINSRLQMLMELLMRRRGMPQGIRIDDMTLRVSERERGEVETNSSFSPLTL